MFFVLCYIFGYLSLVTTTLHRAAQATFPIIAWDPGMRTCGSAVATNKSRPLHSGLAVRNQNQLCTERLRLLAKGRSPQFVPEYLLTNNGNFEGEGTEARQVTILYVDGRIDVNLGGLKYY